MFCFSSNYDKGKEKQFFFQLTTTTTTTKKGQQGALMLNQHGDESVGLPTENVTTDLRED